MKLHFDRLLVPSLAHPEEHCAAVRLEGWATPRPLPSFETRAARAPQDEGLVGCPSTGQIESGTGGKSAKVRCKPGDHLGHFLDLTEAVHRDLAQHVLDMLLGHLAEQL